MPRLVGLFFAVAVLAACKRAPEDPFVAARVDADVLRWAPPPRELRYERKRVVARSGLPLQPVRSTWTRVETSDAGVVYDVITGVEVVRAPQVVQRFRYGADGLSVLAEGALVDGVPQVETWEPPMVVLPPKPAVGAAWEATHTHAGVSRPRSCEILSSDLCDDGLVVVCDRTDPDHRLLTRDHFCADGGWAGYESMLVRDGQPTVRTWTEGMRRVD